jgi:hypothetical protein
MTTTESGALGNLRRWLLHAATAAVLVFACVSAARVVGAQHLGPAASPAGTPPIVFDDHALQYYYGRLGALFLAEGGRTYGYDPAFMAGYPKTPIYYPSSRPYELTLWLFGGADPGRVFNWTVLVLVAACPFLMYAAAWSLGLSEGERLVVVALTAVPHLLAPIADFYRYMEPAGMESYIFASALSVLVATLVARFARRGGLVAGLALWLTAPLLFFTHPTAAVISAVPIACGYLAAVRRMPIARNAWLVLIGITVLVTNWPWIEGQLLFGHYADLRDFYTPGGRKHFVPQGGAVAPLRIFLPTPHALALAPPVLGCAGLVLWWRASRWDLLALFVPQLVFLFVVSFYGASLGLGAIAPGRIMLPLGLWLLPPAAHALVRAVAALAHAGRALVGRPAGEYAALALLALCAFVAARAAQLETRVWRWYTLPGIEASEGFTRHGMALMRWLDQNTDGSGRLLNEETDRSSHQYYGSHMPALIPLNTKLELAGGPAPHALVKHNVLRFEAGTLAGQPLERLPPADVIRQLRLYNVRWVLCWTPGAKRWFAALDGAVTVGGYDKFTLYRMGWEPSYFLEGSGVIEAHPNRIVLRDLVPEAGRVAIKYHWLETLRTTPPREIVPVHVPGDPVPFMAVVEPPRELVIYQDYRVGVVDWLRGRVGGSTAGADLGGRVAGAPRDDQRAASERGPLLVRAHERPPVEPDARAMQAR